MSSNREKETQLQLHFFCHKPVVPIYLFLEEDKLVTANRAGLVAVHCRGRFNIQHGDNWKFVQIDPSGFS